MTLRAVATLSSVILYKLAVSSSIFWKSAPPLLQQQHALVRGTLAMLFQRHLGEAFQTQAPRLPTSHDPVLPRFTGEESGLLRLGLARIRKISEDDPGAVLK